MIGSIMVPPSGGSLEIGNKHKHPNLLSAVLISSPFGGIPRNWKRAEGPGQSGSSRAKVPPSGGSLEIGNTNP